MSFRFRAKLTPNRDAGLKLWNWSERSISGTEGLTLVVIIIHYLSRELFDIFFNNFTGYSGSSNNFVNQVLSETQHTKNNNISINRKGSFNFTYRYDFNSSDKHSDKKNSNYDGTNRLKNVAQYQPPPIPTSPFEQEGMRAAFEMHLDRGDQVQKSSRLKSSFGTKQKPTILNLSKNTSKTVLGKHI